MNFKSIYDRIPSWLKNKYAVISILFFFWIVVIDQSSSIISTIKLRYELYQLKKIKPQIIKENEAVLKHKETLTKDPEKLERYARERYWMKKKDEDLFILKKDTLK